MSKDQTNSPWPARFTALSKMDGAAWDAESDRLETAWKAEYDAAFLACAARRGWKPEDAQKWPAEIHDAAYTHKLSHQCPVTMAELDVIECEDEAHAG